MGGWEERCLGEASAPSLPSFWFQLLFFLLFFLALLALLALMLNLVFYDSNFSSLTVSFF